VKDRAHSTKANAQRTPAPSRDAARGVATREPPGYGIDFIDSVASRSPGVERRALRLDAPSGAAPAVVQRVVGEIPLPASILSLPSFQGAYQRSGEDDGMGDVAVVWASEELTALEAVAKWPKEWQERIHGLYDKVKATAKAVEAKKAQPQALSAVILELADFSAEANAYMFTINSEGQTPLADKEGAIGKFGYHMTKLHNLPAIQVAGLDPQMGASDRGSTAMSTEHQQKGSAQTSAGMVAFGATPGTFRPYINQAEDRRQMIEGVPLELKPVMLRFEIEAAIGSGNVLYGLDYMDKNALNTKEKVPPGMLEVLTGDGWVALSSWTKDASIQPLREIDDDARSGDEWEGVTVVMGWDDLQKATAGAFNDLAGLKERSDQVDWLLAHRDEVVATDKAQKLEYTFRGATMQTSGNLTNWEFALSVKAGGKMPEWLGKFQQAYAKRYSGPAAKHVDAYKK
jgi:hypothetical protein